MTQTNDNIVPILSRATLDTMITAALSHPQVRPNIWSRLVPANDWTLPASMTGVVAALLILVSATFFVTPQNTNGADMDAAYAELSDYMVADLISL